MQPLCGFFAFVVCAFDPKKLLPRSKSISLFPKFSSRNFMVSSLMFKTLINSELIYEQYEIKVQFHCSVCHSPLFPVLVLKEIILSKKKKERERLSFPYWVFLVSLLNTSLLYMLSSLLHYSVYLFLCQYHTAFTTILVQFEIHKCDTSSFLILIECCCSLLIPLLAPNKFQNCFFYVCDEFLWYFNSDYIRSVHGFGQYGHFNNITSSDP